MALTPLCRKFITGDVPGRINWRRRTTGVSVLAEDLRTKCIGCDRYIVLFSALMLHPLIVWPYCRSSCLWNWFSGHDCHYA